MWRSRLSLEQLAAVIVASPGQIVKLEILRHRAQHTGVEEFHMADSHRLVRYVFQRQPFANYRSSGINHIVFGCTQACRFKVDVELEFALRLA